MSRLMFIIFSVYVSFSLAQNKNGQGNPQAGKPVENQAPAALPATSPQLPAVPIPQQSGEIRRDPFRLPEYLINKFKFVPTIEAARIDDAVDPIKRWPLNTYGLIGIIWDVKNPKALIMDQQRKVHMVRVRDKIGNAGGVITSIQEGSIVVIQDKIPEVMRLKK